MEFYYSQVSRRSRDKQLILISQVTEVQAAAKLCEGKSRIKALWEIRVREEVPVSEVQSSVELINSMDIFLEDLINALRQPAVVWLSSSSEQGMSKTHGEQRAKFAGYHLPQLFAEFNILREIIIDDLYHEQLLTFEVRSIIDKVFDSSISQAAAEFASVQQSMIESALEKTEASNVNLEHFASVAAHDLKSPLATISSYLDLLVDESGRSLGQESLVYINVMLKASERMRTLVDRLLDYARLAKVDEPFQVIDVADVISACLQNLHSSIEVTHAKITWNEFPSIRGDFNLLIQLFQNLIANSLKFCGRNSPIIHISAEPQNGMILFSLRDEGIGFNPENCSDIFSLYKKLGGEADTSGTGIGLATCKKVIELHGGRIWADSYPGMGSVFYFTLPVGVSPCQIGSHS